MVGTQRSRVWWVHRGAGYGGYTEEQGMVGTQRSREWWVHRGAGYGGYTEEQEWWVHPLAIHPSITYTHTHQCSTAILHHHQK